MGNKKKIVIAVVAVVVLLATLFAGIILGRSFKIAGNNIQQTDSSSGEIIMPDDMYYLVRALDKYMSADVQQAEVSLIVDSKAFSFDESFQLQSGMYNDKPIVHLKKGVLDGYIYDGKVYVEEEISFEAFSNDYSIEDLELKQLMDLIWYLVQNAEFSVEAAEGQTVYQLGLTGQQLKELLGDEAVKPDNMSVDKAELVLTVEDKELIGIYIGCEGAVFLLGKEIPLKVGADAAVEGLDDMEIFIPQNILEEMK